MQRKGVRKVMFKVSFEETEETILLKYKHNISKYIHRCLVTLQATDLTCKKPNETFDLLWNSLPNAELTDSETSSSFGEGDNLERVLK